MIKLLKFGCSYVANRLRGVHHPAEYYSRIGDDVIPSLNDNFSSIDKPLWLNLGYWKSALTYKDACEDMARLLANSGDFSYHDDILDVGFGYGEQDILWAKEYLVRHITGINITDLHIEVANKRISNSPYIDKITFEYGDATDLHFKDSSFSKVVALESAFHFLPRKRFFSESYRVLTPNGKLIIADMVSKPKEKNNTRWKTKGRSEMFIPDENAIDRHEYCKQIELAGFHISQCISIASHVYSGAAKYFFQRAKGKNIDTLIQITDKDVAKANGNNLWGWAYGMSDYILIVAEKNQEGKK